MDNKEIVKEFLFWLAVEESYNGSDRVSVEIKNMRDRITDEHSYSDVAQKVVDIYSTYIAENFNPKKRK